MRRAAVLTALALVLAGCVGSGGDAGPAGAPGADGDDAPAAGSPATIDGPPTWRVGDFWTYRLSGGPIDEPRDATLVVAANGSEGYVVETTDRQMAFVDAQDDISFLGPQSRTTRAGDQNGTAVQFFQWPLETNRSWTTTWDGIERTVTVDSVQGDTAQLVARGPDGEVDVEYTYDAEAGWVSTWRFHGIDATLELTDAGSGFDGTYVTVELEEVFAGNLTGPSGGFGWSQLVGGAADDFWYQGAYGASGPAFIGAGYSWANATTGEGGGDGVVQATCPCETTTFEGTVEARNGTWHWQGGVTGRGYLDLTLLLRDFVEHSVPGADGS